jgi:hypothetical protein
MNIEKKEEFLSSKKKKENARRFFRPFSSWAVVWRRLASAMSDCQSPDEKRRTQIDEGWS